MNRFATVRKSGSLIAALSTYSKNCSPNKYVVLRHISVSSFGSMSVLSVICHLVISQSWWDTKIEVHHLLDYGNLRGILHQSSPSSHWPQESPSGSVQQTHLSSWLMYLCFLPAGRESWPALWPTCKWVNRWRRRWDREGPFPCGLSCVP